MTTRRRVKIENIRWFFTRFFPLFWCIFLWCRCRCGGGAGWRPPVVSVRFVCQRWRPRVPQFAFNFTIFSDLWPSKAIFLHYFSAVSADCAEIYGGGFFFRVFVDFVWKFFRHSMASCSNYQSILQRSYRFFSKSSQLFRILQYSMQISIRTDGPYLEFGAY